ncbi:universal stress protein [Streptomyces sp. NPDC001621]|uniref:universal stress protein n=1 Tax=Streptomyces sp. NPDC001621 TaxID=3364594 RepID=UPI0036B7C1EA
MDTETNKQARAAVAVHPARPVRQGVAARGQVLSGVGDHAAAGRALARHADDVHARTVAVGRSPRGTLAQIADGGFTTALTHSASCTVALVDPGASPRRLAAAGPAELRGDST